MSKDSKHPWAHFHIGLVTIELETPFRVSAAESDNLFDSVFVTDANGLPCIPGESLAGVLRHALAGDAAPDEDTLCREVFGWQSGAGGAASKVRVSFAHVHTSADRPVAFRGATVDDPVLAFLSAGIARDHVRIGMHGAVDDRGKFDERVVPAGARFTFELAVSQGCPVKLSELVRLLTRPGSNIGGATRRGFGRVKVVRLKTAEFDLTQKEGVQSLARYPSAIERAIDSPVLRSHSLDQTQEGAGWNHCQIKLRPIGTWMVGGGMPTGDEPARQEHEADEAAKPWDRLPLSEGKIVWQASGKNQEVGKVQDGKASFFVLPGSSIKGALRHRTAFHARRMTQQWFEEAGSETPPPAEIELFGEVADKDTGQAGRVHIPDVFVDPSRVERVPLSHVSLDRFTQGPIDHQLYDEVALGPVDITIDVTVRVSGGVSDSAVKAFQAALADLTEGRLSLGSGRGHGRFLGSVEWSREAVFAKELANAGR